MPVPISMSVREQITALRLRGAKLVEIAQQLNLSFWTVRNLYRKFRDHQGATVSPNYSVGLLLRSDKLIYRAALWLKRLHPLWGAGFVLCLLQERYPDRPLPHQRTLQRWWQAKGLRRPCRRSVRQEKDWAKRVHEIWQMDAKSHLKLADQSGASWLTLSDEASGAVLSCRVFPPAGLGADRSANGTSGFACRF